MKRVLSWLKELCVGVVMSNGLSGRQTPTDVLRLCGCCAHHHLRGDASDAQNHKCYAYVSAADVIAGTRARPLCIHERSAVGRCGPTGNMFANKSA